MGIKLKMPGYADSRSFEVYCFILLPGLSFCSYFYDMIPVGVTSAFHWGLLSLTFKLLGFFNVQLVNY